MEKLAKLLYVGIVVAVAYYLLPIFLPFLLAIVIAVLLEPLILWVSNKTKINRIVSSAGILTIFFSIFFTLCYLGISKLAKETYSFLLSVPNRVEILIAENENVREFYTELPSGTKIRIDETINGLIPKLTDFVSGLVPNVFAMMGKFPTYFLFLIIFLIATYIISMELPRLKPIFLRYFEAGKPQKKVEIALDKLKNATVGFLRAQIVLSVLTFIIVFIGLWIIGFDYKITMSLVVVFVDILPIFGTGMVLVPWSIYLFVTGSVTEGVGVLILFVFITIFRRSVESKLISDSLGISPLMTLLSLYIGFELMGIIGMIIGPTILIVIKALEDARLIRIKLKI